MSDTSAHPEYRRALNLAGAAILAIIRSGIARADSDNEILRSVMWAARSHRDFVDFDDDDDDMENLMDRNKTIDDDYDDVVSDY